MSYHSKIIFALNLTAQILVSINKYKILNIILVILLANGEQNLFGSQKSRNRIIYTVPDLAALPESFLCALIIFLLIINPITKVKSVKIFRYSDSSWKIKKS